MEKKKSPEADLEKNRIPLILAGVVFAAALMLVAFEWRTFETRVADLGELELDLIEDEIIPVSIQQPPPPPPPPAPTTVIEIVEDEEEIEEELVMPDLEITENTEVVVEEIQDVQEEVAEEQIFTIVEEMPSFPGGEEALMKYLGNNIRYPAIAKDAGIQGTVYVTFVVEKDGEVTNVRVLRDIGGGTAEEAIRVVENMPDWKPGKQRGKSVKVQYNLPIRFTLR